jgi:hypothetical protein
MPGPIDLLRSLPHPATKDNATDFVGVEDEGDLEKLKQRQSPTSFGVNSTRTENKTESFVGKSGVPDE